MTYLIATSEPGSATQRASWHYETANGTFMAAVTRTEYARENKRGWAWELGFSPSLDAILSPAESVGFHYTGARADDVIWVPTSGEWIDPVTVLHTLATFVDAWREAIESPYPNSENRDLFPTSCERFLEESETFYSATMPVEEDETNFYVWHQDSGTVLALDECQIVRMTDRQEEDISSGAGWAGLQTKETITLPTHYVYSWDGQYDSTNDIKPKGEEE